MKSDYYVYTLCDPRKPGAYEYGEYKFEYEPFYVGKGKSNRCTAHLKESSLKVKSYKNNKIKTILNENLEPIIFKVKDYLIECVSFKYEIDMIKTIGRADLDLGPLTNHTDGGEGMSGWKISDGTRIKRSEANKGKNNPNYGKKASEETKLKMYKSRSGEHNPNYGKTRPEEAKRKQSESMKGKISWNKGKKASIETRTKMCKSKSGEKNPMFGKIPWNKGKTGFIKQSIETIQKRIKTQKRNKELKEQLLHGVHLDETYKLF